MLLTPTPKVSAYINYDYGQNRNASAIDGDGGESSVSNYRSIPLARIAAALHYQATSKIAFTPRFEYFKDESGFSTGLTQNLNEFTLTGEYKMP